MEITKLKQRKTLCVTAIFGNEEKWVKQWCESVLKANPDLIIINLTQYNDNTEQLLLEHLPQDKLILMKHPWTKNFSEARNHTLSAVPDWVDYLIFIDADEVITEDSYPMLDTFLSESHPPFIVMWNIYNAMLTDGLTASLFYPRMWPHRYPDGKVINSHFESAVHNQLIVEDQKIEAVKSPMSLYHYGYALSDEEMKKKHARSEELLRDQIKQNPEDAFAFVNLAQLLRAKEDHYGTLSCAKEAMKLCIQGVVKKDKKSTDLFIMAKEQATTSYLSLNMPKEAEAEALDILDLKPDHLDSLFNLGSIYMALGNTEKARFWLNRFLFIRKNYDENMDDTNIIQNHINSSFLVLYNLGIIEANERNFEKAADYFLKSYKTNENNFEAYIKYVHSYYFIDFNKFNSLANEAMRTHPEKSHLIYDLYCSIALEDLNIEQAKFYAMQAANINAKTPENKRLVKRWENLRSVFGEPSQRFFNPKDADSKFQNRVRT